MDYDSDNYMSDAKSVFDAESDEDFGTGDENIISVPATKPKIRAGAKNKAGNRVNKTGNVLSNKTNMGNVVDTSLADISSKTKNKKTVEEIYQKKSQLEHILLRPDTYSK
jgi:hypothetical protein